MSSHIRVDFNIILYVNKKTKHDTNHFTVGQKIKMYPTLLLIQILKENSVAHIVDNLFKVFCFPLYFLIISS